jgi:hypothetical protein
MPARVCTLTSRKSPFPELAGAVASSIGGFEPTPPLVRPPDHEILRFREFVRFAQDSLMHLATSAVAARRHSNRGDSGSP